MTAGAAIVQVGGDVRAGGAAHRLAGARRTAHARAIHTRGRHATHAAQATRPRSTDANGDDASKCSAINNGQHEIGSGGNGGALYSDGASKSTTLCGDAILANSAGQNAFGGGLFFTSNDYGGTLTITDTTMTGNTGGSWTQVQSGSVTNAGTAVGTNAKSLIVSNSTLQGMK